RSLHDGGCAQTLLVHRPLWQSPPPWHALPGPHLPHFMPPQSTSVSSWFLSPSLQPGAATQTLAVHTSIAAQSASTTHALPLAQGEQLPPPQSTAASPWFFMPSQ